MKPGPEYARRLISRAALQTGVTAARGCAGRAVLRAAAATILLLPAGAAAQAPADSVKAGDVIPMEELVVRVARSVATAGGVSAVVIRLDSLHTPAPAPLLEQSLRSTPLVHVRTNSRGESELSLRGAESRQVAVLVDGVPLTLGWDHRTDVGLVPLTGAQSITLVRGLPSVLHGPNVLGGVVEVGLARAPLVAERPLPLELAAGVDHVGGRSLSVLAASPLRVGRGELLVRTGAGYRKRAGTPIPADAAQGGGRARLRENSDLEHADGFLALRYREPRGGWLSLSASGYRAERGVPPELHLERPRFWRYPAAVRLMAAASAGTGDRVTPLGVGDLEASLGLDLGHTEINSYAGRDYGTPAASEIADDRTATLRLLADHSLGERGELRSALTLAETRHQEHLEPGGAAAYRQRLWSWGAELGWRVPRLAVAGGALSGVRLTTGLALDGADTPETGGRPPVAAFRSWGARAGMSALAAEGRLLLHAGVSRRTRVPSLRELYSGALGRFVPNPALRPEVLAAGEAGATARLGGLNVQGVAFHHRLSHAIVRVSAGDGRFRRVNRDEMRSTGLELVADWGWRGASLSGDLAVQRVRVREGVAGDGAAAAERRAEYQPAVTARADVTLPVPGELRAAGGVEYTGRQWCVHPDLEREVALEPSRRLDLEVRRVWPLRRRAGTPPMSRLETTLALDNVADTAIYDQCGLPQPGRTLRLQLRLR